ncbi:enhancer of mRNA-decapping protein 4 isoform X2 [Cryptomeria japonica]|uniref:enhancer of mRNA-decapping protein 4 isoform X2 n=1 Tax=Cryptomeria japonica TaxID=3369 RepID=UPI0027DA33E7|nr:enhancer of mRNA-decapping protein 4 isoform X2 [Cryptomeria japonica]
MKLPIQYCSSINMSGSKSPKGCYLSGEHVVYYVDDWLPVQVNSELVLFPSKVLQHQDRTLKIGSQISANKQYIGYCIQSGTICIYNRQTGHQCLLQGHQQRVTDMAFCGDQVGLLASASSDGYVFIWSITETSGKEGDQIMRGQILFSIQFLGEWESVHPLVCWRNQDLAVGIDKYVLALTAEELKKNFISCGFAFDNPMRCHVGNLMRGIKFAGVHDLEVTALAVISRCPTLIASASRDGTVRIWRDQEPVPVTRFAPYEGLPVDSVSCLSPFENDLHMILTSGGPENRELKLWVPFDSSCLVPAEVNGKWKCIETVELKNSTDRRPCQLYFNRTLRDSEASLLVVGGTQDSSIYVVHIEFEAHSAYMDYLSKFCVELPISNLTARSDSSGDGEGIVEIFCVHEESIQLYTLHRSQCAPPAHNGVPDSLSPSGCYGHQQELDFSDSLGFSPVESIDYCTLKVDEKAESLSPVSRDINSFSSQSTSSGFGSWIEVPGLFDHLKDVGSAQTTEFVLQDQNSACLSQMNTIAMASLSQQKPVLDLTRNTSLKGIKYSPVDSLGKLPETEAVTNFVTCTVPSVPLGHTTHEILTPNDKQNAKIPTFTDLKGYNHGYPYAIDAASSTVDNTNLFIRNSVHSSVTDQTITGNTHTVLSSDFSDKKTVAMETQELQEMGQTSEFSNWRMSSDMLSLGNIEQVGEDIVCLKRIMNTRVIELPECSDWNYIHARSTSTNISLPCVLGKYPYDGNTDPIHIHGGKAVTSAAAGGGSSYFGGQSRRPVNFNHFKELGLRTALVQDSLHNLANMHAEFQKHISVAVEGSMSEESNRLESCITNHLERCIEGYADENYSEFEDTSTRDYEHNVIEHMASTISKYDFSSAVSENINTVLGPAIARSILSHANMMETNVLRNLSKRQEIIAEKLEKSFVTAAGKHIMEHLQDNLWSKTLQENIGSYFQEKTLTLFEHLLSKVIERVNTIIQEEHDYSFEIPGDLANNLILVASTLKEIILFATMDLRSMEEELREGLNRVLDLMHCNADYVFKGCNDSNNTEVDPSNIFTSNPLPVSQIVLLFLIQQLACDLESNMAKKLLWIQEAATAINPNDPILSDYIRPVLKQVYQNLQRQLIKINPGSTLLKQVKVIMHVINSLLMSCA